MTRFVYWRPLTWGIAGFSVLMLVWLPLGQVTIGHVALVLALWVMGLVGLGVVWFSTRPLWRQGRGLRWRRLRSL